ncbi:hypothetical protein CFP65_1523 [Kitasatospora sp. MMS16-BH015]|uniref:regulator n=1 Tax=Kitasatospora sp. MMS16-BH015 TaxID=2018025 RepID=UPI000CA31F62|nr:regulator [Kitasatospora sp. MMS16-BH015]AUG76413.1 hypothetical protein CFP65_1523 [Kitasatospora sp. MMS16-BH015]
MLDPLSVTAVTAFLTAAGTSMASEAGKLAMESVGGMVRRITGRETPAPTGAAERRAVAEVLVRAAGQDAGLAAGLSVLIDRARPAFAVPELLPAGPRHFTDRDGPLAALTKEAARKADGRPRVAAVYGESGIGTTAVVLHWGHREAHRYPDGRLHYDLQGSSLATSPDLSTVLAHFLRCLGLPAEEVPASLDERLREYRTRIAGRRLLVVLDHVRSAAQVRELVTGAPGVFTVVISRRPLTGLDAVPVPVGPLADKDALRLLTDLAGKQTLKAAKATLPAVLASCGGSPYALHAAAPQLLAGPPVARPGWSPVTAAVDTAYRGLTPAAARLYRLGGLRPWPALGPELAAALTGADPAEATELLGALADAQLIEPGPTGRYRYRESVRAHAESAAQAEEGLAGCTAAVRRALAAQLRLAVQADLTAHRQRWQLGPLYRELTPGPAETIGAAVTALAAELPNLVETVRTAEEFDDPETVWQCVEALWALQLKAGHNELLLPALRMGVRAAEAHHPGSRIAGRMHTQLAFGLMELQQDAEAEAELLAAAEADRQAGHRRGRATAVESLGLLRLRQWRFTEALDCFEQAAALLREIAPGEDGEADVPRGLALLERHQGRARRGLGQYARAEVQLLAALEYFEKTEENYNAARVLTDLAENHLLAGEPAAARPLIDRAATLLRAERATAHLAHLESLRARCS